MSKTKEKEAQEYASKAVDSVAERNRAAREKIGNDPEKLAERISIVDRDKYDVSGYTDKEINMALQGSIWDRNDMCRLTGECGGDPKPPAPKPPSGNDNKTSGGPGPFSGSVNTVSGDGSNVGGISSSGDNNSVIYGDNNTVDNSSFSQDFGDEVRVFKSGRRKPMFIHSYYGDREVGFNPGDSGRRDYDYWMKAWQ